MSRFLPIALAVAAAGLGGCVTSHVRPPQASPPSAYEAPRPSDGGLEAAALDRWWTLYGDDQLDALVDEALAHAPDQKSALAVLAQAGAVRRATLDQLFIPQGAVTGSVARTHARVLESAAASLGGVLTQPGDTNSLQGQFAVSWELDLLGRRSAGKKTADAELEAALFDYQAARTALIAQVAQSLFQARGLALQIRDARETARIDDDLAAAAEARFKAGLSPLSDADQARAQAEAARAEARDLQAQLLAAQRSLLVLLGRGFDRVASLPVAGDVGTLPPVPATAPGDLLRRRPDVRAAEQRIVSAAGALRTADLALWPTINLDPSAVVSKSTGPFGYASTAFSAGAALSAPVLDRPRLIAQIHARRAVAEQDVVAYEKAVQTAYAEAETTLSGLASDRDRVAGLQDAEGRAHSAYQAAAARYAAGLDDVTAALQAEAIWRAASRQLTAARISLMERSVQVFKALGGGWSPDPPGKAAVASR